MKKLKEDTHYLLNLLITIDNIYITITSNKSRDHVTCAMRPISREIGLMTQIESRYPLPLETVINHYSVLFPTILVVNKESGL